MQKFRLDDMTRGWFVGDFTPTALPTQAAEVAVKNYRADEHEAWHYHKVATEVTLILTGEVEMNGVRHRAGDILIIAPGEGTDFRAVTPVTTVVVKVRAAANDKYLRGE